MKEVIQKVLLKGMNADEMPQEVNDDTIQYALNMRRLHSEGDTMAMQNLKGTTKAIAFPLGTKILGTCTHLDVCFFFGVNTETNHSFIGTYPSPKYDGTAGYVHEFKYLNNYTGAVNQYAGVYRDAPTTVPVQPMYVPYLNTLEPLIDSTSFEIEAVSKGENDGSVTLYWTDRNNPVKTINCGFYLKTGLPNYRFYSNDQLNSGYLEVLNESKYFGYYTIFLLVRKMVVKLEIGGQMDAGGYHFFFKYVDEFGNKTSCYDQSKFIFTTISDHVDSPHPTGSITSDPNNIKGAPSFTKTNKLIKVYLNGLDPAYPYVEIYYAYHYSGDEWVEEATTEYRKIIKPYWKGNAKTFVTNVYGTEEYVVVSRDELFSEKSNHNIAKTIQIVDNTLYLANTKESKPLHKKEYADFAQLVVPSISNIIYKPTEVLNNNLLDTRTVKGEFVNNNPHTEIGYFGGEIYAFALRYRLTSGKLTPTYPIKGGDFIDLNNVVYNNKGIVRFPMNGDMPCYSGGGLLVKPIQLDFTNAKQTIALQDVAEIEIVRTKRNPLMLYQGVNIEGFNIKKEGGLDPATRMTEHHFMGVPKDEFDAKKEANNLNTGTRRTDIWNGIVPLMTNIGNPVCYVSDASKKTDVFADVPDFLFYTPLGLNVTLVNNAFSVFKQQFWALPGPNVIGANFRSESTGFLSFDYFIDSKIDLLLAENLFVYTFQKGYFIKYKDKTITITQGSYVISSTSVFFFDEVFTTGQNVSYSSNANGIYLKLWSGVENKGFKTAFSMGSNPSLDSWFSYFIDDDITNFSGKSWRKNLPFALTAFIGLNHKNKGDSIIINDTEDQNSYNRFREYISNIYDKDPYAIDIKEWYIPSNEQYYKIDTLINRVIDEDYGAIVTIWGGDCFLQKTYMKYYSQYKKGRNGDFNEFTVTGNSIDKNYGYGIGMFLESKYNSCMRYEKGGNRLLQVVNGKDFYEEVTNGDNPESWFYNHGYSKVLDGRTTLTYDQSFQHSLSVMEAKSRIYVSSKDSLSGTADGLRDIAPLSYKDFDQKYGGITKLVTLNNSLFSVHYHGVLLHPINERSVVQGTQGSAFVFGNKDSLPEQVQIITEEYGSQHQFAVIKGVSGFMAIDYKKRVLWGFFGQFDVFSLKKGINSDLYDMIERTSITGHYSDATKPIVENIIGVYDEKNKEFLFSFKSLYLNETDTTGQGRCRQMRTLSFSEMFQDFGSYYSYDPERYFTIQDDLYSIRNYQPVPEDDPVLEMWLHDHNSERCLFYDRQDDTVLRLKFGKDYTSKQWDNMQLNQNGTDWTSVRYWTDRQYAVQDPFINPNEEWYAPKYYRGQWDISIRRADGNKGHLNTAEDEDSIMEGTGLLVEFRRSVNDAFIPKEDDDLPDRGYSGVALIIKSIIVFCTKTFR